LCKKCKTWCISLLCATAKDKNIKNIFEKRKNHKKTTTSAKIREKVKKRKKVAHNEK
jgi:hypothetical protein